MEKSINGFPFEKYAPLSLVEIEMKQRAQDFYDLMNRRRSVRDFSDKPVDEQLVKNLLLTAGTAPSGAHKQPWTFCLVKNATIKKQIREAAEKEEYESYNSRMSPEWLEDLLPLQTDWRKPFLETAPYLIVVFKRIFETNEEGKKKNNYYVSESVGIACGMLIAAIHNAGLVTLTHTPSPMNFLAEILKRPENERAYLLLPVGYPANETYVPVLKRKSEEELIKEY